MWRQATGADRPEWEVVETPFETDLYDAEQTPKGAYAVGEGGTIVADEGEGWDVVFDGGPSTTDRQVRAMDATADGGRLWMVGAEGGLACYDVEDEKHFEYSYPVEMTSTWEGIAVAGDRGEEKGVAADGRGGILPFSLDGYDVDWGKLAAPDEEATVDALAASPDGVAYAIGSDSTAYKTTIKDGWSEAGVVDPETTFHDLDAWENERVYVAADNGCIYRYENEADEWAPLGVVKSVPLNSMALHDEGDGNAQMAAVGDDNQLYERTGPESWERTDLPTEATLFDLSLGSPDLLVGTGGTVLERERTGAATELGGGHGELKDRKKQAADDVDADDPPDAPDGDEKAAGDAADGSDADAVGGTTPEPAEETGSDDEDGTDVDDDDAPDPPDEPDA